LLLIQKTYDKYFFSSECPAGLVGGVEYCYNHSSSHRNRNSNSNSEWKNTIAVKCNNLYDIRHQHYRDINDSILDLDIDSDINLDINLPLSRLSG